MKRVLFTVLSTVFIADACWAANDSYVSAQVGLSLPTNKLDVGVDKDYPYKGRIENSATYGVSVGRRIANDLFGELEYTYTPDASLSQTHSFMDGTEPASIAALSEVQSQSVMANLKYHIKTDVLPFTPYLIGGAGVSYNKIKNVDSTTVMGPDTMTSIFQGKTTTSFAWQAGVGGLYALSDSFDLDFAVKYKDAGQVRSTVQNLTNGKLNDTTPVKGRLSALNFTIGLKYNF